MLTREQDFEVIDAGGVPRCKPRTSAAASAFKALQVLLQRIAPQLPNKPDVDLTADGEIGPGVTLLVQLILMRLAESGHDQLAPLAVAQPEDAIPATAAMAMEIAGYIDAVLTRAPTALLAPSQPQLAGTDPIAMLKGLFTARRIAASVGVIAGITGLALAARATDKRALGLVDRSQFLPPSDGSDDLGADADEPEDGGEDESGDNGDEHAFEPTPTVALPPGPIIDVAA